MRHRFAAVSLALALSPLLAFGAAAAPMSTSDLLKPESVVEQTWCKRYCYAHGYCGHGYKKYRCCKVWKKKCY